MPDQKMSLENILDEYSPEGKKPRTSVGRVDAQKILNSTVEAPDEAPKDERRVKQSHERSSLFDNAHRQPVPADDYKPADLSRQRITVVGKNEINEITDTTVRKSDGQFAQPASPVRMAPDEAPKIRRMSDSTRAKEVVERKRRKKQHSRKKLPDYTYDRESPDGEYMYTPPSFRKKKKSRAAMVAAAESPEGRKHITDIVPSPAAVEAAKPVIPTPRAAMTSLDLSQRGEVDASALDVHITQGQDEYLSVKAKKKRTKRIVDFNHYGDVEDVGRDIFELKSTISSRVVILFMTAFLSLYITLGNQFSLPILDMFSRTEHVKTYITAHLVLGLIAVLSSIAVITKGLRKLFTFQSDSDTMTAITALTCIIAAIPAFYHPDMVKADSVHIYMPVGILALLFNALGKMTIIKRAARNFRFVSKNPSRTGVVYVDNEERAERLTRGTLGDFPILASTRRTDFLTDFLRYTYSSDMTDRYCRKAAPLSMLFSAIIAVFIAYCRKSSYTGLETAAFGLSIFSMMMCAASCIAMPFVVNMPLEKAAERAFDNKGIILGYQSVDDFYDANSILVNARELFPEGTVKLDGIKVFSNTKLDEALLEAASLTHHGGSIMKQLFSDVTDGRDDMLYPIDNYSFEESMGMCGWINNKRILFGNRELMTSHNIEGLPTKTKEAEFTEGDHEALYLSISGNLAAMFIVELTADKNVRRWARRLAKSKVCMIVKSVDPCLSARKLHTVFGIPEDMVRVLPKRLHTDFDAETGKAVRLSASMATTGKFTSLAQLMISAKTIHTSAIIGLILQTASMVLGLGLCLMLIVSKAFMTSYVYMSATALIIYNLACTLLTYIAVTMKKT